MLVLRVERESVFGANFREEELSGADWGRTPHFHNTIVGRTMFHTIPLRSVAINGKCYSIYYLF